MYVRRETLLYSTLRSICPRQSPADSTQLIHTQADITDIHRHFELEVPRRALFNLIIRYAVCAFSSRHMNRAQGDEGWAESESLHYHNKCLEMLIPILSNLDHELTEDVLAAVAILRLDEEMESKSLQSVDFCFVPILCYVTLRIEA